MRDVCLSLHRVYVDQDRMIVTLLSTVMVPVERYVHHPINVLGLVLSLTPSEFSALDTP